MCVWENEIENGEERKEGEGEKEERERRGESLSDIYNNTPMSGVSWY